MIKKRRKKIRIRNNKRLLVINVLLVSLFFITIGYSLLSTNLGFYGNIHFKEYMEPTLYNVLKDAAKEGIYAKEYTGDHNDSIDETLSTEKIYHWYASTDDDDKANEILNKRNVIFAGFCWEMLRTTDTGGVKMIYNGIPNNGKCNATGADKRIDVEEFINSRGSSPADVGYMYNTRYAYSSRNLTTTTTILYSSTLSTSYWYADSVIWNDTTEEYELVNPYQITSTSDYPNLVGKYTFFSDTETYGDFYVDYIASVNESTVYFIELEDGDTLADYNYTYTYGDSYTDNGNGTYTINNPTTINKTNYYSNYSNMNNKYICKNATNNTCSELWYSISTKVTSISYLKTTNNYKYANGFTYNNGTYTLNSESVSMWNNTDSNYNTNLNNHHYTCWNTSGTCSTISYIYAVNETKPYYINITNGKSVEDALDEMLSNDNVNQNSSIIKTKIDTWYQNNMTSYTAQLEDTIFCNNRKIYQLGGWNPNGGSVSENLTFKEYSRNNYSLECENETDSFSLANTKAQLTYPVGLMTADEVLMSDNNIITHSDENYWVSAPGWFTYKSATAYYVSSGGTEAERGIRPVVSLKPETRYVSGDGSRDDPYIVSLGIPSSPTFSETGISGGTKIVTITYPEGCGTDFTCTYTKNDGEPVEVTTTTVEVPFTGSGELEATISDGMATATENYSVLFNRLYVKSDGSDTTGFGTIDAPYQTLNKAYSKAENTATIYVMDNVTATDTLNMNKAKNITITSCTKESNTSCPTSTANSIIRGSSLTNKVINQDAGTLKLETITIDGNNVSTSNPMIYIKSTTNINNNTTIQNAISSGDGGAIYNNGGTLNISGGTITNNTAERGGGIFSVGGKLRFNSGEVSHNSTSSTGAGIWTTSDFVMNGGTVNDNASGYIGGGIHCTYSVPTQTECNMTINDGLITRNSTNSPISGNGGGVFVNADEGLSATAQILGGVISYNTTNTTGTNTYSGGAGVHNRGTLTLGSVTISNNTALTGGGGVQNIGSLTIDGTTITGNTAGYGGGINNTYADDQSVFGKLLIKNATITNNTATTNNGRSGNGGGIQNCASTMEIKNVNISNNTATGKGGGISHVYDSGLSQYLVGNSNKLGKLTISGATISTNNASAQGGGIYISADATHQNEIIISPANSATISIDHNAGTYGGGIYANTDVTTKIQGGTISNNTSTNSGGAIYAYGTLSITSGTMSSNTAGTYGGGIMCKTTCTMSGGTIASNKATNNSGGGVYIDGTFSLSGGVIKKNTASTNGGIYKSSSGTYTRTGGYVCKNNSPTNSYDITDTSNTNCS